MLQEQEVIEKGNSGHCSKMGSGAEREVKRQNWKYMPTTMMMKKVEVFADEIESENMSVKIPGSNLLLRLNLERLNQGWINLRRELKIQKAFSASPH